MEPSTDKAPATAVAPNERSAQHSARDSGRLVRWLGLAANVAALIGLYLVVMQLQQNRELTRAQIRHELAVGIVDLLQVPAGNAQLASVLRRGAAGEALTPDELFQFRLRANALLRYWENVHYQYRQGLYDEVEFARQKAAWAASLRDSVGMTRYWCEVRALYSPLFAADLDGLLPAPGCRVGPVTGENGGGASDVPPATGSPAAP
jgi:hypothetical protein